MRGREGEALEGGRRERRHEKEGRGGEGREVSSVTRGQAGRIHPSRTPAA